MLKTLDLVRTGKTPVDITPIANYLIPFWIVLLLLGAAIVVMKIDWGAFFALEDDENTDDFENLNAGTKKKDSTNKNWLPTVIAYAVEHDQEEFLIGDEKTKKVIWVKAELKRIQEHVLTQEQDEVKDLAKVLRPVFEDHELMKNYVFKSTGACLDHLEQGQRNLFSDQAKVLEVKIAAAQSEVNRERKLLEKAQAVKLEYWDLRKKNPHLFSTWDLSLKLERELDKNDPDQRLLQEFENLKKHLKANRFVSGKLLKDRSDEIVLSCGLLDYFDKMELSKKREWCLMSIRPEGEWKQTGLKRFTILDHKVHCVPSVEAMRRK